MSEVKDRLRALQRQSGRVEATPSRATEMVSELRRLIGRRERTRQSLAAPAGIEIAEGVFAVERRWRSIRSEQLSLPWGDVESVRRERLVCFDTETTGLAGGVGTKAFMIGWGRWQEKEFVVRIIYLTKMAGEPAMLRAFTDGLPDQPIFIGYNSRSYDAPLLKGRYRMHRQANPFDDHRHVDLLHPTRRRYRGVYENCRLQTIERHVLGIVRDDDLPGSEAPGAWLAFLRGQSSVNLGRVIQHNRQDVLTVGRLLNHLCDARSMDN
jgi:uncharacterized protein YprB with RNaseH-like and TPR domain